MAEIMKPELNELDRRRANDIFIFLRKRGRNPATKKEICEALGWEYTDSNDRRIRELISNLSRVVAIISTSDNRGYRLATCEEDYEAVYHQLCENRKRAREIETRNPPLEQFIREVERRRCEREGSPIVNSSDF